MNTNEEKEREELEKFCQWFYDLYPMGCRSENDMLIAWQAGRAALRAESEPVYQVMNYERDWYDVSKEEYDDIVTTSISKRILYTAPQTEPNGTGSEI